GFCRKSVLIEVMTSRSNRQIADIRSAYEEMFMVELETDFSRRTSGYLQESTLYVLLRLLITLCDCNRDETEATDQISATQDAFKLYNARRFRFGLENCFIEILTKRNFKQLALIFDEYEK
ncbi:Annexin, partial [Oesophagostomum dentatum]